MTSITRAGLQLAAAAALTAGSLTSTAGPVSAATPGCSTSSHCYSTITGSGTTFYGMYGTWNRAPLNSGSTATSPKFITSEMWAANGARTAWVEVGHVAGSVNPPGTANYPTGYKAFYAYMTTGGSYAEFSFGNLTANIDVTDEFQISRASTTNTWRVYFNGNLKTTPGVGFWTTPQLDAGGEVATAVGTGSLVTMYLKGINASGSRVNLGTETTYVDDPPLYGNRPGESTWKWRIRA